MGLMRNKQFINSMNSHTESIDDNTSAIYKNSKSLDKLTKGVKLSGDKISKSINGLTKAISDEKIEIKNEYYSELLNKQSLLIKANHFINSYFSYVYYCLSGVGDTEHSDNYLHHKNNRYVLMYPPSEVKNSYLQDLDLYVKINENEKYLSLFEKTSGLLEFDFEENINLSNGSTIIAKKEYSRILKFIENINEKINVLNNIESVCYNIFENLIKAKLLNIWYTQMPNLNNTKYELGSKIYGLIQYRYEYNLRTKYIIFKEYLESEDYILTSCINFGLDNNQERFINLEKDRLMHICDSEGKILKNTGFNKQARILIKASDNKRFRGFRIPQYFELDLSVVN